jgi:hypothetical protein
MERLCAPHSLRMVAGKWEHLKVTPGLTPIIRINGGHAKVTLDENEIRLVSGDTATGLTDGEYILADTGETLTVDGLTVRCTGTVTRLNSMSAAVSTFTIGDKVCVVGKHGNAYFELDCTNTRNDSSPWKGAHVAIVSNHAWWKKATDNQVVCTGKKLAIDGILQRPRTVIAGTYLRIGVGAGDGNFNDDTEYYHENGVRIKFNDGVATITVGDEDAVRLSGAAGVGGGEDAVRLSVGDAAVVGGHVYSRPVSDTVATGAATVAAAGAGSGLENRTMVYLMKAAAVLFGSVASAGVLGPADGNLNNILMNSVLAAGISLFSYAGDMASYAEYGLN